MTRREIAWRLEMAAKRMELRGAKVRAGSDSGIVDKTTSFTEKESVRLDSELEEAKRRVLARFKKNTP